MTKNIDPTENCGHPLFIAVDDRYDIRLDICVICGKEFVSIEEVEE